MKTTSALTDSDNVEEPTELAEVELASLDTLAALHHRDEDGHGVRRGEADDTNAREGVKGRSRAKVDDTEDDLDSHREHHGVEGNIQLGVDLAPPLGAGDGTVTREGPGAARGGGGAGGTAENAEDNDDHEKTESAAGRTNSRLDDRRRRLAGGEGDELGKVGEDEHEGHEEEEATNRVHDNGENHSAGHLGGRALDFLAHGDDHASRRSGVSGVKETDTERPASGPAGRGLKVAERVGTAAATVLGDSKDGDQDGDQTRHGPVNGKRVEVGQVLVAEGRDGVADKGDGEEREEDLVRLGVPDADSRLAFEDVDARDEEEGRAELHGQGDGDVADDVRPATDVGSHALVVARGEHERLVVDTTGSRVDTGDLTERGGDTKNDQRDDNPAPDDDNGSTTLEGVVEGRGETVGDRGEDERHEGDMEGRARAHKLGLVAHLVEEVVGRVGRDRRRLTARERGAANVMVVVVAVVVVLGGIVHLCAAVAARLAGLEVCHGVVEQLREIFIGLKWSCEEGKRGVVGLTGALLNVLAAVVVSLCLLRPSCRCEKEGGTSSEWWTFQCYKRTDKREYERVCTQGMGKGAGGEKKERRRRCVDTGNR